MVNTLVIITDTRSTLNGTAMHELGTDEAGARHKFAKEISNPRYHVEVIPRMTITAYIMRREKGAK